MKYVLILYVMWGTAPVIPEHHALTSAEFDDLPACMAVIERLQKAARFGRVQGGCYPKSSDKATEPPFSDGKR